ncbi:MAG: ribosomal protein L7/L12 [Alphaproteobacteria bacterium]|nr:ribosomal protein L7/L12 [Alphaproteobacteria bacterium]
MTEPALFVLLRSPGPRRVDVIRALRHHLGLGLKEATALADHGPVRLGEALGPDAREALRDALLALGAVLDGPQGDRPEGVEASVHLESVGPRREPVLAALRRALRCTAEEARALAARAPLALRVPGDEAAAELLAALKVAGASAWLGGATLEEPDEVTVWLLRAGPNRARVLRELRLASDVVGISQLAALIKRAPAALPDRFTRPAAEDLVARLRRLGALAEIR